MTLDRAVDAAVFDYGGTLAWFERPDAAIAAAHEAIAERLAAAGHRRVDPERLQAEYHDRVDRELAAAAADGALAEVDVVALERRALADLGLHVDDALLDACSTLVQEAWWEGAHLYPDAVPALRALRAQGMRIGVCSNAPYRAASMHAQLHHVGITGMVDVAVFSAEVGWRKPSPAPFRAVLDRLGVSPSRAVFIGDRVREDVDGASAVGMATVLVARDGEQPGADRADATVSSLVALPALLHVGTHG